MVERDVPIYRYTKGFLHQKVLLMDDQIATVGSVNFDNRSFAINFELTVWMTAERNIRDVETMLEADFARCRAVTRDDVRNRSPRRQFIEAAAKLLSPIL
jgi:cardiolipin synthase A/B